MLQRYNNLLRYASVYLHINVTSASITNMAKPLSDAKTFLGFHFVHQVGRWFNPILAFIAALKQ